ncbi:Glutathione transport system permease protein GsiD [bioreactor metagenome]|uniref:Glutathione transport system permease protein GsiD n=1 Tax=bioreactor metagenome TaxID=1076179 RepID=A0A644YLS3_9ZZZZ
MGNLKNSAKKKRNINVSLVLGSILIFAVAAICIVSFVFMPHDPTEMNTAIKFLKPGNNSEFLFGTDNFGRDILSRIMRGSRTVLLVGVVSTGVGAAVGIVLGACAGMRKGIVSTLIMRFVDGVMAFPGILLAMMLVTVIGRGEKGSIIAIAIFIVPTFARLVYSMVLDTESMLFVKAAKSYGITNSRLFKNHYMPIMATRLITQFSSSIAHAIMIDTSLSFLGLGIQPPNASWGLMLNESRQYFLMNPYLAVAPGVAIVFTVLGFNLLGDGLNDLLENRKGGKR